MTSKTHRHQIFDRSNKKQVLLAEQARPNVYFFRVLECHGASSPDNVEEVFDSCNCSLGKHVLIQVQKMEVITPPD